MIGKEPKPGESQFSKLLGEFKAKVETKANDLEWVGTLGVDMFMDQYGHWWIVETNGSTSGFGKEKIPKGMVSYADRIKARIRGRNNPDYPDVLDKARAFDETLKLAGKPVTRYEMRHMETGFSEEAFPRVQKYVRDILDKAAYPLHANPNPPYIRDLCDNKLNHPKFTPLENSARKLVGPFGKLNLKTVPESGFWIVKPVDGARGEGIHIFPDIKRDEGELFSDTEEDKVFMLDVLEFRLRNKILEITTHYSRLWGREVDIEDLVVEELIRSAPPDATKNTELFDRPASMRLIIDFKVVNKNGKMEILVGNCDAFWRIAKTSEMYIDGVPNNDFFVVNSSTGALSRDASGAEKIAGKDLVLKLIENLNKLYIQKLDMEALVAKLKEEIEGITAEK